MNSNPQNVRFMHLALEQARRAESVGEVPVGAVVVKDGQVIGVGHNQPILSNDPTAHAEIVALRAAAQALGNYRLEGCTLYVTLEPCAMCAGAILEARIPQVVYGAEEPKKGAAGSVVNLFTQRQFNHHTTITSGILAAESGNLLANFFIARRRTHQAAAQPLREDALRTPADCFAAVDEVLSESKYLRVGDGVPQWRLHYIDIGPQEATTSVLLVHDVPGWGHRWSMLLPLLVEAGFRVLAPDLLGFGRSDKPKKKHKHSEQLHFQCLDAMVNLVHSGSRIVTIGQGLGMQLVRRWALGRGRQIDELIAIAPSSSDVARDNCPHPNQGFMSGIEFFEEWAQGHPVELGKVSSSYTLDSPQSILSGVKSVEGTG
jgi:tRNA(adenine34) deaminase